MPEKPVRKVFSFHVCCSVYFFITRYFYAHITSRVTGSRPLCCHKPEIFIRNGSLHSSKSCPTVRVQRLICTHVISFPRIQSILIRYIFYLNSKCRVSICPQLQERGPVCLCLYRGRPSASSSVSPPMTPAIRGLPEAALTEPD